jgi:pantothenate kinase-related protein Tda10
MNSVEQYFQEPVGKIKMEQSLHDNVEFLNPGDTLLLEEKHWSASSVVVQSVLDLEIFSVNGSGKKLVIEISGPSGAGKTEIGYCIGSYLGKMGLRCVCYSTDNCYEIEPNERARIRKEAYEKGELSSVIGPKEYDWELINQIENGLLNGQKIETPLVDVTKSDRPIAKKEVDYSKYDVLLLDGLYAIGGIGSVKVCISQTWEGVLKAQHERGKETTDEQRMAIIKLEMEAVNQMIKEASGNVFKIDPNGKVERCLS